MSEINLRITVVVNEKWSTHDFHDDVDVSTPQKLANVVRELIIDNPAVLTEAIRNSLSGSLTVEPINDPPSNRLDSPFC